MDILCKGEHGSQHCTRTCPESGAQNERRYEYLSSGTTTSLIKPFERRESKMVSTTGWSAEFKTGLYRDRSRPPAKQRAREREWWAGGGAHRQTSSKMIRSPACREGRRLSGCLARAHGWRRLRTTPLSDWRGEALAQGVRRHVMCVCVSTYVCVCVCCKNERERERDVWIFLQSQFRLAEGVPFTSFCSAGSP